MSGECGECGSTLLSGDDVTVCTECQTVLVDGAVTGWQVLSTEMMES